MTLLREPFRATGPRTLGGQLPGLVSMPTAFHLAEWCGPGKGEWDKAGADNCQTPSESRLLPPNTAVTLSGTSFSEPCILIQEMGIIIHARVVLRFK